MGWETVPEEEEVVAAKDTSEWETVDAPEGQYVPANLKGTDFEDNLQEVEDTLDLGGREDAFQQRIALDKGRVQWAAKAHGLNAKEAARVQELSVKSEIPFHLIRRDLEGYDASQKEKDLYKKLFDTQMVNGKATYKYPSFINLMKNPQAAPQAQADIDALTNLEVSFSKKNDEFLSRPLKEGAKQVVSDIASNINIIADRFGVEAPLFDPKNIDLLRPVPVQFEGLKGYVGNVVRVAPQVAGTIASVGTAAALGAPAAVAGLAGGSFMAAQILGGKYNRLREAGVSPDRALTFAAMDAAGQGALEAIPLMSWVKLFKTPGTKQTVERIFKTIATEMGAEYIQEYVDSYTTHLGVADTKGQTFREANLEFVSNIPETHKQGVEAALVMAPWAILGAGVNVTNDIFKAQQVEQNIANLEEQEAWAEKSELRKSNPEAFEKHIDTLLEESGEADTFTVPLEVLTENIQEFYQDVSDKPKKVEETLEKLGVSDQVTDSQETGQEIEIKRSKWLTHYANTELSKSIKPDMRIDGLTLNERKEVLKEAEKVLEGVEEELQEVKPKKQETVKELNEMRSTLMLPEKEGGAGFTAEEADSSLMLWYARGSVASKVWGVDIDTWVKDIVKPTLKVSEGGSLKKEEIFQDGKKGSVRFADNETLISLFKQADFSTFLHESAHVFAKEMQIMVDNNVGDEQLKTDFKTLSDFAGGEFNIEGQEKIARAFEAYLREGKAPNAKLVSAFRTFSNWLRKIYRSMRDLNVEIDDDVREVFDRMLSSEEDIQALRKAEKDIADTLPELPKEVKEKAKKTREEAEKAAIDKRVGQLLKARVASLEGIEGIRKSQQAIADKEQVYVTIDSIKEQGGMSVEDLDKVTIAQLKGKHGAGLIAAEGKGANSFTVAADSGYENPDIMLNDMLEVEGKAEEVEIRTKKEVKDIEEALRREITRDELRPGEEAYHNADQLNLIIAEVELLASKVESQRKNKVGREKRKAEHAALKNKAKEIIDEKKWGEASRYDLFAKSEAKFSKQAYELAKEGKFEEAYLAKRRELLNHYLVGEAVRTRDEKVKIKSRYTGKKLNSSLKNIENDFKEYASAVINTYSFSKAILPQAEVTPDLEKLDEGLAVITPDWILKRTFPDNARSIKDLTMAQYREVDETIQSIIRVGRKEFISLREELVQNSDEFVDEVVANAEGIDAVFEIRKKLSNKGFLRRKIEIVRRLDSSLVKIQQVFEHLDDFQFTRTGNFGRMRRVFDRGREATGEEQKIKRAVVKSADKHWNTLSRFREKMEKRFGGKEFAIPGIETSPELQKKGVYKWTPEMMVSFMQNLGNAGNVQSMKNGYNITEEQIDIMSRHFTTEEVLAIQSIWDVTDSLWEGFDASHFEIYNRHLTKVEAVERTFVTADGEVTVPGGYHPLVFDHSINFQAGQQQANKDAREEDMMSNRRLSMFQQSTPNNAATYSRTPGHSLPPLLAVSVWYTHINDVVKYTTHSAYLRDVNRIFKNPKFRNMVVEKSGEASYKDMQGWANYLALPERRVPQDPFSKLLNLQRSAATNYILGLNISVGVKQRLSILNAMSEMGVTKSIPYLFQAVGQMGLGPSITGAVTEGNTLAQDVLKMSDYLAAREGNIDRELSDTASKLSPLVRSVKIAGRTFTTQDVKDFVFLWIKSNDKVAVTLVWKASYDLRMDENATKLIDGKGMTEEQRTADAANYADNIVQTSQPSSLPIDQSALQRSEGAVRAFIPFMTFTLVYQNRMRAHVRAYDAGAISFKEMIGKMSFETIPSAWGSMLISAVFSASDWPEWEDYITKIFSTGVSGVPFARDLESAFSRGENLGAPIAFEGVNIAIDAVRAGKKVMTKGARNKDVEKFFWEMSELVQFATGVPATKPFKQINNAYKSLTDQKKKR